MADDRAKEFGLTAPPVPAAGDTRAAEFGLTPPSAAAPAPGGAFYGAATLLPEGVQKYLPSFVKGPSVGEQLSSERERTVAAEQQAGRPLTLGERLKVNPASESPVAMGFGTHQIGDAAPAALSASAVRSAKGLAPTAQVSGVFPDTSEKFIKDQYTRAVKPTTIGKGKASDIDRYQAQTRDAISSIVDNKANLQFTDDAGNVRKGELPKTLEEFGDAIEQTKQTIFDKYDALAQQSSNTGFAVTNRATGQTGTVWATVPLNGVVSELQGIAADPVTGLMHPELVKYAQDRAAAFSQRGALSASDAQRAVASLNQTLKAFYRNPTYETAARANVDAMIANQLRESLDQTIRYTTGPGYQDLKNQYGALKAIEGDVNKRSQVVARQEKGGGILGRIADVGSAEEVIRGLVTLSPAAVVRGTALKLGAEFVKYRRSPNRAVMRLFDEAYKQSNPPASRPIIPPVPLSPVLPQPGSYQDPMLGLVGAQR